MSIKITQFFFALRIKWRNLHPNIATKHLNICFKFSSLQISRGEKNSHTNNLVVVVSQMIFFRAFSTDLIVAYENNKKLNYTQFIFIFNVLKINFYFFPFSFILLNFFLEFRVMSRVLLTPLGRNRKCFESNFSFFAQREERKEESQKIICINLS